MKVLGQLKFAICDINLPKQTWRWDTQKRKHGAETQKPMVFAIKWQRWTIFLVQKTWHTLFIFIAWEEAAMTLFKMSLFVFHRMNKLIWRKKKISYCIFLVNYKLFLIGGTIYLNNNNKKSQTEAHNKQQE